MEPRESQIESLFFTALEKPTPAEQAEYLAAACAGDDELQARVQRLLDAQRQMGGFLQEESPAFAPERSINESPGTEIGPYRLLEQIGEGGFGVVFRAQQTMPVRRIVALKVIKPGMDTRQVIARFEAERQALAMMDHPNIAKVLDAGTTDHGRPYFVMELVVGVPITRYCDDNRLTARQRLELFIPVCQAIQHAHQRGIIHRDLKPSNVLVAERDDRVVPKIIDFGVAKAVGGKLTDKTMFTQNGQLVGTLEYMSPEQAKFNHFDVDTRTDVYALGVLLYELLTGTTPFSHDRLQTAAFDEMLRILRDEEPPKPSTRLTAIDDLPSVAANRQIEPARLGRLLRGELDWIVMKALEKDRNRRYETANAFACDVQRYLADETVQASPPSVGYRLRKLARRNKVMVVAAGLVLMSLIGGVVGTTWQAVRATSERNEKEQARHESATNERKAVTEAARARDQEALAERQRDRAENNFRLAREAVDQMLTRVAEDMAGQPHMEQIRRALLVDALKFYQDFLEEKGDDPSIRQETARAYLRVGRIYILLGQLEAAEAPLREALGLMQKLAAEFPAVPEYRSELVDVHNMLNSLFADNHLIRPGERLQHAMAADAILKQLAADFPDQPEMRRRLADQRLVVGVAYAPFDAKEAERYFREGLAAWEELQAESTEDRAVVVTVSRAHHWLGWLFKDTDRLSEAEAEFRRELAIRATLKEPEPFYDSMTRAYLARILLKTGRPEEAEPLIREVIAYREQGLHDFPNLYDGWRRLSIEYSTLGDCLDTLGRTDECEQALRRGLQIAQKLASDFRGNSDANAAHAVAWRFYDLGRLLQDMGRIAEAEEMFREAQMRFEENAARSSATAAQINSLAWFLADCPATQFRDPPRAIELAKQALQLEPQSTRYRSTLGVAQARAGQWQQAHDSIHGSMKFSAEADVTDWFILARAQWHIGNQPQARGWYDRAVREMQTKRLHREEFRRHRAEAAALLGVTDPLLPGLAPPAAPTPDC